MLNEHLLAFFNLKIIFMFTKVPITFILVGIRNIGLGNWLDELVETFVRVRSC